MERSHSIIVANPASTRSLAKKFPEHLMPGEELTGHCYFEALKWLDRYRLLIKVSGTSSGF